MLAFFNHRLFSTIGYFHGHHSNIGVMRKLGCELPSIVLLESLNIAWHSGDSTIRVSWCTQSLVKVMFLKTAHYLFCNFISPASWMKGPSLNVNEQRRECTIDVGFSDGLLFWFMLCKDVVHIQLIKGFFFSVYP